MYMYVSPKSDKTKISLTHPYPYSFHNTHSPGTTETSLLVSLLVMFSTHLKVVESFQPLI